MYLRHIRGAAITGGMAGITGGMAVTTEVITGTGGMAGILTGGGVPHFGHTTGGARGATPITEGTIIPITGDTITLIILTCRTLTTVEASTIIIS